MNMKFLASLLVLSALAAPALAHTTLVAPGGCSTAGDQTARPVYKRVNGKLVFVGYECVQDNRGGNGG